MGEPYRTEPEVTRVEFGAVVDDVRDLQERLHKVEGKPRGMLPLRLIDTLGLGLAITVAGIVGMGWLYDGIAMSGLKVSLGITDVLVGVVGIGTVITSLAGLEHRSGLRSPWKKDG